MEAGIRITQNVGNKPHTLLNTQIDRQKQSIQNKDVWGRTRSATNTVISSIGRESRKGQIYLV